MQVRRPIGVAVEITQQLAHRTVIGDGTILRLDRAEPVMAILTRYEDSKQVEIRLDPFLLHVVKAFLIGLPDVDPHALDGPTCGIGDSPGHDDILALAIEADMAPIGISGASATWNGPSMVDSDAPEGLR